WSIPTLAEVQSLLELDEVLIDYYEGTESIYALVITKTDNHFVRINSAHKVRSLIGDYYDHILTKKTTSKDTSTLSKRLYQNIVAPLAPYLKERVIISPNGILFQIPFAALETSSQMGDRHYMIYDHAISYTPSASFFYFMRKIKEEHKIRKALLVAPEFALKGNGKKTIAMRSEYFPLKENIHEVTAISNYFYRSELLKDSSATKSATLHNMSEADIIHFSSHAKSNKDAPEKSHMVFYQKTGYEEEDYKLYFVDISERNIKAKMVVLSACETNLGKIVKGEGAMSLANSFFYGGAQGVVASLWLVDDQMAKELMSSFYTYLDKGFPKDLALQKTQVDFLKEHDGVRSNPFFWSAFSVNGDTRPLHFRRPDFYLKWMLFGLVAVFFSLYLRRHLRNKASKNLLS
ncbi:MAG: CHAT domain-containing protein, partial [Bacteroidota bacterium]